jgi:hypothetical protein
MYLSVCMYVYMYVFFYVSMYLCMCCVCMYVLMCVCSLEVILFGVAILFLEWACVRTYVHTYVCVCMYA